MAKGDGVRRAAVSDKAVLSYLALVWGVDVAALRNRVAREAASGVAHGACACNRGRAKFVIAGQGAVAVVTTVTHRSALPRRPRDET